MPETIIISPLCGRGGIGIRARLRGVFGNEYGFKSRRPHFFEALRIFLGVFLYLFPEKGGYLYAHPAYSSR